MARYPSSKAVFSKTVFLTRGGHRIDLRGVLPQQVGQVVEFGALLGEAGRLPVRVIILRVPDEASSAQHATVPSPLSREGKMLL